MATPTDDGSGGESSGESPGIIRDNPLFLRIAVAEVILVAMAAFVLQRWGDSELGNVVFAILVSVVILTLVPTVLIAVSAIVADRKFR